MIEIIIPAFILSMVGYFGYRFVKHGGLRGALYGSTVSRTIGEIDLGRRTGTRFVLRVHVLENGDIVVEQAARALLGASIQGFPMSPDSVDRLIEILRQARA